VDFYLWFRYRPNERDEDFKPDEFVFTNAEDEPGIALIREESNPDGTVLKTYRVSGPFKNQFRFYDYPFEHQDLIIEFRNQNATTSFIQYVVDRTGMRYESEDKLLENFRDNGAFNSIFGWRAQGVHVAQDIFPTFSTFGSPQNFGRAVATNYSLININVDIQRDSLQYIVKSLLPLLITLILAYITFFLPLGHSERLAVGSTALLTTAFFHLTLADALPEIGYTVAMEYLFYASYAMSALMVLLETLSIRLEKRGEDEKKKADKEIIKNQRETLNMLGRLIYPAILLFVLIAGFFVYNGTIRLGPNEAESKHIVDLVIDSGASTRAKVDSDEGPTLVSDEIKLTFSTWRPEDSDQIQILLNEFQAYAQDNGKNIIVEHRPVVSVNYDSILDIQLSREEGPDLLYVRPFSVDGSIARYLTQLNTLPIEENYDVTKTVPWMNRSGAYYAVPYVGVVQGVYYNKDFFEEHPDIPSPDTWNSWRDFLSNVQKIRDAGKIPIANALNQSEDSEMFMSVAANFLGGPDGRASLMRTDNTSLCYNNQKVVNIFQAMETLKPYLPAEAATINSQTSKELFFNQDAVLLFGGSWDLQTVSNGASFDWGVFAVPSPFSRTYVIFQPDAGIGINRDTRYPQETRMFLEWLMTKEAVDLTAQNLAGFYPLSNTKASGSSGPNDEKFLALVNNYDSDIRWMYTEISSRVPSALEIVRRDLYNMVAFDMTPQEAAQNLQNGLGEWYEPAQSCR
jgi:ABC-type glycerol-3-phosphate transport system substrate-binding protein